MTLLTDIEDLRAGSRRKTKIILLMALALVVMAFANMALFAVKPEKAVVAMTTDGRVLPLPTMDEPFHTSERVLSWAADRIEETYSMTFADLESYPSKLSFMTPEVKSQFIESLNRSGIIDKVANERRLLRAVRKESPSLQKEGVHKGRYVWSIQMPVQLNFEGANNIDRSSLIVSVVVGRAPLTEQENGLVIGKIDFVRSGR